MSIEAIHFRTDILPLRLTENPLLLNAQISGLSPQLVDEKLISGIDTDAIIPTDACKNPNPDNLAEFALTGIFEPGEIKKIWPNVMAAGENFGSGSSREHAPIALFNAGVFLVYAPSFAPIFRRNATNIGLWTTSNPELIQLIEKGNPIPFIKILEEMDPLSQAILKSGGLLPYLSDLKSGRKHVPETTTTKRPMNIAEKWLSQYLNYEYVKPGDFGLIKPKRAYSYEYTIPLSASILQQFLQGEVIIQKPQQLVFFNDHLPLDDDPRSQALEQTTRNLAKEYRIKLYDGKLNPNDMGICHTVMLHESLPGIIAGTDSHTPMIAPAGIFPIPIGATEFAGIMLTQEMLVTVPETVRINFIGQLPKYSTARDIMFWLSWKDKAIHNFSSRVMEFGGSGLSSFSIEQLSVMANATAECRAFSAVFEPTENIARFLVHNGKADSITQVFDLLPKPDSDAIYFIKIAIDLTQIEPMIMFPSSPDNGYLLSEIKPIAINKVLIGACVGGGIEDIRIVADLLNNKQINSAVKLIIHPHSFAVLKYCEEQGWLKTIENAGGQVIRDIGCGECVGNGPGKLEKDDIALTNESRNHKGRMGNIHAQVYLSNTYVCVATAILGHTPTITELKQFISAMAS